MVLKFVKGRRRFIKHLYVIRTIRAKGARLEKKKPRTFFILMEGSGKKAYTGIGPEVKDNSLFG
jgi:hypothetical protein